MGKKAILAGLIGLPIGIGVGELITSFITGTYHGMGPGPTYTMRAFFDMTIGGGLAKGLYDGMRGREKREEYERRSGRSKVPLSTRQSKEDEGKVVYKHLSGEIIKNPVEGHMTMDEAVARLRKIEQKLDDEVQDYVSKHPELSQEPKEVQGAYYFRDVRGQKVNIKKVREAALRKRELQKLGIEKN